MYVGQNEHTFRLEDVLRLLGSCAEMFTFTVFPSRYTEFQTCPFPDFLCRNSRLVQAQKRYFSIPTNFSRFSLP